MYKTAVYTLVNGVITHQKQQISKNVILRSMTLLWFELQYVHGQNHLEHRRVQDFTTEGITGVDREITKRGEPADPGVWKRSPPKPEAECESVVHYLTFSLKCMTL